MAADLVRHKVAVLVSTGGEPSVLAARAATTTIPIVFTSGIDPIRAGIVTSLSRPGGNITGVYLFTSQIESKAAWLAARACSGSPINRRTSQFEPAGLHPSEEGR